MHQSSQLCLCMFHLRLRRLLSGPPVLANSARHCPERTLQKELQNDLLGLYPHYNKSPSFLSAIIILTPVIHGHHSYLFYRLDLDTRLPLGTLPLSSISIFAAIIHRSLSAHQTLFPPLETTNSPTASPLAHTNLLAQNHNVLHIQRLFLHLPPPPLAQPHLAPAPPRTPTKSPYEALAAAARKIGSSESKPVSASRVGAAEEYQKGQSA